MICINVQNYVIFVFLGIGFSWQDNYNKNGWKANAGLDTEVEAIYKLFEDYENNSEYINYIYAINYSIYYQWKLGKSLNFFSLGISYTDTYWGNFPLPIVSFDRRF